MRRTTGARIGSWKGAAHESREISTVGTVARQLLVKTLLAGKDLACALVNCKVWELVLAL
jgi:hypothetical protein